MQLSISINRKILFYLAVSLLVFSLGMSLSHGQEEKSAMAGVDKFSLPEAGLTPDSPLYFLKSWKEQIQLFFTFGAENKAKQYLHLAGVRLAEYQRMVEKGKTEIAERTLQKYEDQLGRALKKAEELKDKGQDIKKLAEEAASTTKKQLEVLQENLAKVPEQAKEGLERALEASQKALGRGEVVKTIVVSLSVQNNSGESGTAVLSERGGKTEVKLRLEGAPKGVTQPAHIHSGACASIGGVKWPLTFPVNGKSETTLDISFDQLRAQLPLVLNVHKSAAEAGVYVACGDLAF
ncbi:MAG: hypothetical protein HZB99_00695 [Candidatus Harrisonbacteria bacterium]|nr:hypothetical protein [Candidatus Harrisonbacteria bacterium]